MGGAVVVDVGDGSREFVCWGELRLFCDQEGAEGCYGDCGYERGDPWEDGFKPTIFSM